VPRAGLQVDTDRVDTGPTMLGATSPAAAAGALMGCHHVRKYKSRQFRAGTSEFIAHGADGLRRIHTGESEEIKNPRPAPLSNDRRFRCPWDTTISCDP
jgi:hypothetical protein